IENSGQINILPMLNMYVPGIFVTERNSLGFGVSTGSAGSIIVRGISGSPNTGVLILVDGHPQYQGIFGHPLPDSYVATDLDKVEVIRGPASILYGTNAMAGVINLITRKNEKPQWNGSLGASYGSYNTHKVFGTIGYKNKKWDIFASINNDKTDGIRYNTDFRITNGYTKIGYTINDKLNVVADINIADFVANDNGTIYIPKPFGIDISRGKTSFSLYNKFSKSEGAIKIYHNFGTHDLSDGWHSTDRNSGLMVYQTIKPFKGNTLTVGTDFKQYGGKANSGVAKDQLKTVNEIAGYIYTQQILQEKLMVSAGLRLENNSNFGNQWVPSAGIAYNPTSFTTFKGVVSKGFRSPTIMEMYLFAPNSALMPEKMLNYEISWLQRFLNNKIRFELTGYIINGDDMIQVVGAFPNVKRQNVGKFSNKGIELSFNYKPTAEFQLFGNYSYLHQDVKTLAAPRQQINLYANYSYKKWSLNGGFQYIEKLCTKLTPETAEYYLLANTRLSFIPAKGITFFLSGNNLFDEKYEINYGYPMPGFNFIGGINVKF
ncbi:MAG: TonB-dependent receptor, partial [Chitinophagaceae bacterium]